MSSNISIKIKRAAACQKRHFHLWLWQRLTKNIGFFSRRFPKLYQSHYYYYAKLRLPDYKNPRDINECLLLSSLKHLDDPLRPLCADKYEVRKYVSARCGEDALVGLIGVYDSFDEIDFDALPESFVMKVTNASGRNYLCRDKSKIDKAELKRTFDRWLADRDFGLASAEWHYSQIKPRIIIEEYLDVLSSGTLTDYKFHCARGEVFSCFCVYYRDPENPHSYFLFNEYSPEWELNEKACLTPAPDDKKADVPVPGKLAQMLQIARKLSEDFDYVRVDLYDVGSGDDEKVLFGELTFTPAGNMLYYYAQEHLDAMGSWYKTINKL